MAAGNRWFWPSCFSVVIEFMRDENISRSRMSDQASGRGAAQLVLKQRDTMAIEQNAWWSRPVFGKSPYRANQGIAVRCLDGEAKLVGDFVWLARGKAIAELPGRRRTIGECVRDSRKLLVAIETPRMRVGLQHRKANRLRRSGADIGEAARVCRQASHLQTARRRNANQRDRGIGRKPIDFAACDGDCLVNRIDPGEVDQLTADNHEDVRRDSAVAVIDRRIFPELPKAIERSPRRGRADDAVPALDPNDAIEIDGADWIAALLEESPASLLDLALKNAHTRRGRRQRHPVRLDAHRLGRDLTCLDFTDLVAALAGAHLGGPHSCGANAVGVLVDLDGDFDVAWSGTQRHDRFERLTTNPLEILRLRIGNDALHYITYQRQRDANGGNHLGVFRYLVPKTGTRGGVGDQSGGAATFADQHRLVAIELVFGDQIVDHGNNFVSSDVQDCAGRVLDRFPDEFGERRHRPLRRFKIAMGMQSRLGVAQYVRGAGVGDGIANAV